MKNIFSVLVLCLAVLSCASQSNHAVTKGLKTGDHVPDFRFGPFTNYTKPYAKFSDFKGKLVIIDFWGTYCTGCILAFPLLDSLQKHFGNAIQIILVNNQSRKEIDHFRAIQKKYASSYSLPNLPSATGNKKLDSLFPHTLIPHEVWIDGNGVVTAVTESEQLTVENIARKLKDPAYALPEKTDFLSHDAEQALLPQVYPVDARVLKYYSSLLSYVPGLDGTTYRYNIDPSEHTIRMTRSPMPILQLYADALTNMAGYGYPYEDEYFDYGKRVDLRVRDSARLILVRPVSEEWKRQNYFGYEQVVPIELKDSMYAMMLTDLDKFLQLHGRIEKRTMKCQAIIRTGNGEKFKAKQMDLAASYARDTTPHYQLFNANMNVFRKRLSGIYKKTPFVFADDTGYTGNIDIELHCVMDDLPALRKELGEKYDLDIVEKLIPVEVMVITDSN